MMTDVNCIRCAILTTDTIHHRFFASKISKIAQVRTFIEQKKMNHTKLFFSKILREKSIESLINNPYFPNNYPVFEKKQKTFEECQFTKEIIPQTDSHFLDYSFYDINDEKCVESIKFFKPDLIISFGTGVIRSQILKQNCLKINIHRGILPKYRGLDSDLWACYFKDFNNLGTTIHTLQQDLDTGDILCQKHISIKPPLEVYQIRYYTTVIASQMVESIIQELNNNGEHIIHCPQNLKEGHYYSFIPPIKRWMAIKNFNEYIRGYSS